LEILEKICDGHGSEADLDKLENLGRVICDTSLCGLGISAPYPVLSTLNFFREEYEAHVREQKCPAGACENLLNFSVVPDKCIGCNICAKLCPVKCISGKPKGKYIIDQEACIKCGVCLDKCPKDAIIRG
jgi:NAD-dependent dihydropyrimidine dehydrogenase PreA subunit